MKRTSWGAGLTVLAMVSLALSTTGGTASAATPAAGAASAATCTYTPAVPADNFKGIPVFDAQKAAKPYSATLRTSQGQITFQALTDKAPCTTFSFRFLAEKDYYDRTHCHRLTTQRLYVLQCGDPTGTGSGGPGYSFPDENLNGATYPMRHRRDGQRRAEHQRQPVLHRLEGHQALPGLHPFGRVTATSTCCRRSPPHGEDDQNGPGDGFPTLPVNIRNVGISKR